jgi:hypothetical protein
VCGQEVFQRDFPEMSLLLARVENFSSKLKAIGNLWQCWATLAQAIA